MKLDPGMHIGLHLVFFGKSGVTWPMWFPQSTPPGFFLIQIEPLSLAAAPTSPPPSPHRCVHIREDKVFTQLGPCSDPEPHRWVLDTGATNHMTGERSVFSELNTRVSGTVRFGDGSVAEIEGSGTVVFICKN
jgi:hypothetical protein